MSIDSIHRSRSTIRELPALCLIVGAIFTGATLLSCNTIRKIPSDANLQTMSGRLQRWALQTCTGCNHQLDLDLVAADRVHHLTQKDMSVIGYGAQSLREGDSISVKVEADEKGRDLEWLWELRTEHRAIFTYATLASYFERRNKRAVRTALFLSVLSAALFAIGVVLRLSFGTWRDPRRSRT